ncbi:hypothetical protein MMC08_002187 [Hypocenomyce scalaris]|nr:hypothetical protein [Hypocenomyce scalaris]
MSGLRNTPRSIDGQVISEVAREEGGPYKGSTTARLQSQVTKEKNLQQATAEVGSKLEQDPSSITSQDAEYLQSRAARATGGQVPQGSVASQAQHLAAAKEQGIINTEFPTSKGGLDPTVQSQLDREANYVEVASEVQDKMDTDPASVTPEEANLVKSREARAFGTTEKGGVASQAQSLASQNEKGGNV